MRPGVQRFAPAPATGFDSHWEAGDPTLGLSSALADLPMLTRQLQSLFAGQQVFVAGRCGTFTQGWEAVARAPSSQTIHLPR